MDLNPGVVFAGRQLEINATTKYSYQARSVPERKLSQAEMLDIKRWRAADSSERLSEDNGLLLTRNTLSALIGESPGVRCHDVSNSAAAE